VHSSGDSVLSFGIGLNMENIASFFMKQWTEITQKQYSCSFLKDMQQEIKAQNPAAMSMATGMAGSVRGIAFSLLSLTMEKVEAGGFPMPKEVDAIISLAVKDPAVLLQTVSAMVPPLAALQIPADGTPVPLPLPIPLPFPIMAAINGSHLTVYVGEKAGEIAKGLRKIPLDASQGLMAADFDYGKYYRMFGPMLSNLNGIDAQTASIFEAMKNIKMRLQMGIDFTDNGIEIHANMVSAE